MNVNITIIGCGWLGQQLAASLIDSGQNVRGNYRTSKTKTDLVDLRIEPFKWEIAESDLVQIDQEITSTTDVLIICLPPSCAEDYPLVLQNLVLQFKDDVLVIFTSSTGIYPKREGVFDETYEFNKQEKDSVLYRAENRLRSLLKNRLTILRLGGLIGPNRHPIKFVSGKTYDDDGSAPINLIDSRDICLLVDFLIENEKFGSLFNVVCPSTLSKRSYYSAIAKELTLESPSYGMISGIQRVVRGDYVENSLGFQYKFDVNKFDTKLLFV